ncbi:Cys-tRNA(Pro) deacylase [Nocardioides sp. SYSU DS0663]|uniref:Cys-tRNA(Pro) deacylase n=1 Tax=Nocardioides sp. SYSU DS0663 TaxID=3416445 RepID=UPI003F4C3AD3
MGKKGRSRAGGTPATVALTAAGVEFTTHEYVHDPRAASYGLEAAEALGQSLGLDPACVLKTLMVRADPSAGPGGGGWLAVGIVPVDRQLDLKAVARAVGAGKAVMADVAAAERATGYVAGGISPVGQRRAHPTVVDESVLAHPKVYVSGGRRGLDLGLSPGDLVAATSAVVAAISR